MAAANKREKISWHGVGGDRMASQGLSPLIHCRDMAFIGFVDVIKNLRTILGNMARVKRDLIAQNVDALLLIDYPGFNLKMAKFAKSRGIKVIYYITPQLWAWHKSRVYQMRDFVDEIINIFPFEVDFYKSYGITSHYFGHPITEGLAPASSKNEFNERFSIGSQQAIGLLAGSRASEVKNNLPIFYNAFRLYKEENPAAIALVSVVGGLDKSLYTVPSDLKEHVRLVEDMPYDVMAYSELVLICSGTATLETACFETPMIVCYHTGWFTSLIVKWILKIKEICLVNIVNGSTVVPELLQKEFNPVRVFEEMNRVLLDADNMRKNLSVVREKLSHENVSEQVATFVLEKTIHA